MKKGTEEELTKARQLSAEARLILQAGFHAVAAREAYLAIFHAALAYLLEARNERAKTHSGVHSRFAAAAKEDPALGPAMGRFLARSYEHKQDRDYGIAEPIPEAEAQDMLENAEAFIARIEQALAPPAGE